MGKKGPKKIECGGGGDGEDDKEDSGCGTPDFDDTVVADCASKTCTFSCVDVALTPNSLTATCGKKGWSFDDKKIKSATCASTDDSEKNDSGKDDSDKENPVHKCDMTAFEGITISDCTESKESVCTVTCSDPATPSTESVSCKKGKWNVDSITCA